MTESAERPDVKTERILFVPGYGDTELPIMMERLRKTDALWWQGDWRRYDWIIVSGGITKRRQLVSEAKIMKNWLVRHARIAPGNIITECCSRDSFESVRNVVEGYLREPMYFAKNFEVTVVSQYEHAIRLKVTFEAYGIPVNIVSVPGYSFFQRVIEWGYLCYTLCDPKGESWFSRWKVDRVRRRTVQGF